MTGMYSYHSNPEDYFANARNDRQQSFRAVGEESLARLVRDISLTLNMTGIF